RARNQEPGATGHPCLGCHRKLFRAPSWNAIGQEQLPDCRRQRCYRHFGWMAARHPAIAVTRNVIRRRYDEDGARRLDVDGAVLTEVRAVVDGHPLRDLEQEAATTTLPSFARRREQTAIGAEQREFRLCLGRVRDRKSVV